MTAGDRPNEIDLVQTDIIFVREASDLRAKTFVFQIPDWSSAA